MAGMSRIDLAVEGTFERMKNAYLASVAQLKEQDGPKAKQILAEFKAANSSDEIDAIPLFILKYGQAVYNQQVGYAIAALKRKQAQEGASLNV